MVEHLLIVGKSKFAYAGFLLATLLLLNTIPVTFAQVSTGTLRGTITDTLDNRIPFAVVILKDINTGLTFHGAAAEDGRYRIRAILPGVYRVTVNLIGYAPAVLPRVEIEIGQTKEASFRLRSSELVIGGVEVVGTRPVEVDRTNVSTVIREAQIEAIPVSSRNFIDLSALAPGVRSYSGATPSYGAFNQLRFLNVYVDGSEWKNRFNSNTMGNVQSGVVPQSAIQEFRFLNNAYDAEYGRGGAFIITAITKRGGNDMHINAFYKYRNKEWNALGAFQKEKPVFR